MVHDTFFSVLGPPSGSYNLVENLTDPGWIDKISHLFEEDYFKQLQATLTKEAKTAQIFPPQVLVFNAFNLTPFDKVSRWDRQYVKFVIA